MMSTVGSFFRPWVFGLSLAFAASSIRGQAAWPPDDEQLKTYLMGEFIAIDGYDASVTSRLKDGGVTDEQLRRVLMSVYTESETAFERAKDQYARMVGKMRRANSIRELGCCADDATKTFLLNLAADQTKDGSLRVIAIASYLSAADAEETKDALIRFLVTSNRIGNDMDRSEIYTFAYTAWQHSSPEKKLAICEALQVGLAHEPTHWVFCSGDRWLCGMSPRYARSKERLAMFERMYATPVPDGELFDKRSLIPQLEMMRKLKVLNSISTNLSALQERDFSQLLPEDERFALEMLPETPAVVGTAQEKPSRGAHKGIYAVAAVAGLLAAFALWLGIRRKRGSA